MPVAISPVPSPRKLARRLGRRLQALLERQEELLALCRREGTPAQIHELRAVTRRLRVLIGLATPLLGRKRAGAVIRDTRRLSRATSRMRDCDVSLTILAHQAGQAHTISALQRRRHRLWLRHRHELTTETALGSRQFERLQKGAARLARRYARKLKRHRTTLLALIPDFATLPPHQQHAFRRTVRRLRYLRELGLPRHRSLEDPICAALTRTQGTVGGLLDAAVCRANLQALKATSSTAAADGIAARRSSRISRTLRKLRLTLSRWKVTGVPAARD